jgi:hypothetical protein
MAYHGCFESRASHQQGFLRFPIYSILLTVTSFLVLLLLQLADLIERDAEYLAALETLDNGKPLAEAQFDMVCAVNCLRYYAGNLKKNL